MNPLDSLRPEIRTLEPYSVEQGSARVKMDANESPFQPSETIMEEISDLFRCLHVNRYPDPGARNLKKRIAEGMGIEPDRMMLGNGSDELISYLITAFSGRNTGVLVPAPTFSMYGILARTLGQPVIEVPLDASFQVDPDQILQVIRESSPQIVFLASPNNPTGTLFPEEAVRQIIQESGTLVVADEAYIDFSDHPGFLKDLDAYPNLIILRTLSKIGMAGLRIGILAASRDILHALEKIRLPYNINTLSQTAAAVLLGHPGIFRGQIRTIVQERGRLIEAMSKIPDLDIFPSQANFILFRTRAAGELYESLLQAGILIRNLDQPGALKRCLRVTVGKAEENSEFLGHLGNFFRGGE